MYLHLDQNTALLNEHQRQYDAREELNQILDRKVRQHALSLAATYSDDKQMRETLDEQPGNNDEFDAALRELYDNILLSGKKATVPSALVQMVEDIAVSRFESQALSDLQE